jgi:hypothetical protein
MWCKWCRQHVPVNRASKRGALACAQCGRELGREALATTQAAGLAGAAEHGVDLGPSGSPIGRATAYEDWQLDQNIQQLQARVGNWRQRDPMHSDVGPPQFTRSRSRRAVDDRPRRRFDQAHATVPRRRKRKSRAPRRSSLLAGCFLALGLTALACGAALMIWSVVEARDELWSLGMPITIGGQVALLLGLVLQLERVWQNGRDAVRKLDRVDDQLHQLEQATSLLNPQHGTASQAFYAHMSENASPDLLLADLKGQLDVLSAEIGRRR